MQEEELFSKDVHYLWGFEISVASDLVILMRGMNLGACSYYILLVVLVV